MASSKLIPSNPADVMVIRSVTPNITTFSVPFLRGGLFAIGGRGTLVRLTSGALAVFSPVALTDDVKAAVNALGGNLKYIVAPDIEHHIFISTWAKAYPGAQIIGPQGLPEKRAKQAAAGKDPMIEDNKFAVVFEDKTKRDVRISEEFDADFEYELVDAHPSKELVFFYKPDRVLIQADLLFNLPATEQYSKVKDYQRSFGTKLFESLQTTEGDLKWTRRFQWHLQSVKNRPSFNESITRIDSWDFNTIIPCHGDVMEGDGKERFRSVFEWHLKGQKP